jgi:hypothetical protein
VENSTDLHPTQAISGIALFIVLNRITVRPGLDKAGRMQS